MAVAALVNSDSADAGLGILAAAKAFDLDFVEVAVEEYDFAVPVKFLDTPQVRQFIKVLQSEEFKEKLDQLGGYTYENIGEIAE
jgi:putative molybdopterin biosynthesis protein